MTKIVFLGKLKDSAGMSERDVSLPSMSTPEELIAFIAGDNEILAAQLSESSVRIIINKSILPDRILPDVMDEVAFMPPLSGG